MKHKVIGVLMGGMSSERAVSLTTGAAVTEALLNRGYTAVPIDVGPDLPERLRQEGVQVAWMALHGRYGEDGCVQGLLEVMGIPYTGSGVCASAIAMSKAMTKRLLGHHKVPMPKGWIVHRGDALPIVERFPVVVKPSSGGSTVGITVVHHNQDLAPALTTAVAQDPHVVIEELLTGYEITVAVFDDEPLPVVGIEPESGFFDYEAKYIKGKTVYKVPAPIEPKVAEQAQQTALVAYRTLGCRGLARADFIVNKQGVPLFLEINTLPGMTPTSLCPMAAGEAGIDFETLVERVLLRARTDW